MCFRGEAGETQERGDFAVLSEVPQNVDQISNEFSI